MPYGRVSIKTYSNNQIVFDVDDNSIAISLFGESDKNIKYIEKSLNLKINARGNILFIQGEQATRAKSVLSSLIKDIREKKIIDNDDVENAIRLSSVNDEEIRKTVINTPKKKVFARSLAQSKFMKSFIYIVLSPANSIISCLESLSKKNAEKIMTKQII